MKSSQVQVKQIVVTKQRSIRMQNPPTIWVSVTTTRCQYQWGTVGPQVNQFEQVSGDDHQMSVAGGEGGIQVPCLGVPPTM